MALSIAVRRAELTDTPLLVIALPPDSQVPAALTSLDTALAGALDRTLRRKDFRGSRDETLHLAGGATGPQRVLLVGLGKGDRVMALRRAATLAGDGRSFREISAERIAVSSLPAETLPPEHGRG